MVRCLDDSRQKGLVCDVTVLNKARLQGWPRLVHELKPGMHRLCFHLYARTAAFVARVCDRYTSLALVVLPQTEPQMG